MPGLIGYTKKNAYDETMLEGMRKLLKHSNWYKDDIIYSDNQISGSRTHLGIIDQGLQPFHTNDQLFSWMEGEWYNQSELISKYKVVSSNDNELFLNIYHKTRSFDFLREVDGYYAAVVYDKVGSNVFLITDRYGFKPLYWGILNGSLIWSSELKGFLGHKDFKIKLDPISIEQFFNVGYQLENRTWFDGINMMPPAAVLAFSIRTSYVSQSHYWQWSDIKPIDGAVKEPEIIEELGQLFENAVRRRVSEKERIGISLSGGLDSRAILAAVPDGYKPLHTFTFGKKGCDDIRIAKKAATLKGSVHHELKIASNNWMAPRIDGVWKTDGFLNLLHMHGIEYFNGSSLFLI